MDDDPELWWPEVEDVAGVIARLTVGPSGVATGTFSEDTTPTLDQVQSAIVGMAHEVAFQAGDTAVAQWRADPTLTSAGLARRVVALGAASQVALSFYPSSAAGDLAERLEARYVAALGRLVPSAVTSGSGGAVSVPASPVGAFPPAPSTVVPPYLWRPW